MGAVFGFASRDNGGALRRFVNAPKQEPTPRSHAALDARHPAVTQGHTLFPTRVFDPAERDRVLISGYNNSKIGKLVTKGPWRGFPIYTLSLEERATCPKSCAVWAECYGNALPMSVRFRHGPALILALDRDLTQLQASHPGGFVVRLHVLGDFYDLPYVAQWWRFMETFPALRVWGYTAHAPDSAVGAALGMMNGQFAGRWSIRNSVAPATGAAPMQAATAWSMAETADGIVCPAETGATQTCGTCGLCWAPAAAEKRIVFLGHGMTKRGGRKREGQRPASAAKVIAAPAAADGDLLAYLRRGRDAYAGMTAAFDALIAFHSQAVPVMETPSPVALSGPTAHETAAAPKVKRSVPPERLEQLRRAAARMREVRLAKYQRGDGAAQQAKATQASTSPGPTPQPPANAPGRSDASERPSAPVVSPARQPKSRMEAIAAVSKAVDENRAGTRTPPPNSVSRFFAQPFGRAAEKVRATGVPTDDQIAAWIAKNGVTRLPAAAVDETSATISPADQRAIAEHQAAMDAAWRDKNPQRNKGPTAASLQAQSISWRRADR